MVLTLLGAAGFAQTVATPPTVQTSGPAAFALAPGQSASLRVQVRDSAGAAVAGASVIFHGPADLGGGSFDGAAPGEPFLVVQSDASGIATATFRTGPAPGVLSIGASTGDAIRSAVFAISTVQTASPPAAGAEAVRAAVQLLYPAGASVLNGPYLLPAGATVLPAHPERRAATGVPMVTKTPAWFFWMDDAPESRFQHPVRFILLDAEKPAADAAASATIAPVNWWPLVVLPGQPRPVSLLPSGDTLLLGGAASASAASGQPKFPSLFRLAKVPPEQACAIIVHGPDAPGSPADVLRFRDYVLGQNVVAPGNILLNAPLTTVAPDGPRKSITRADLQRLIDEAAKKNCKKLYFYYSGHGTSKDDGAGIVLVNEAGDGTDVLPYEDLARMMQPLKGAELCMIVDACYSGQLIDWFRGKGYRGAILTGSDADNVAYGTRGPNGFGYVTYHVLLALQDSAADANKDGEISFDEALTHAKNGATPFFKSRFSKANPLHSAIQGTGVREAPTKGDYQPIPGTYMISVLRPKDVPLLAAYQATVRSQAPSIVTFGGGQTASVTIPPGMQSFPIVYQALVEGVAPYDLEGEDASSGLKYRGSNAIEIGRFAVGPRRIIMFVGGSKELKITRFGYWLGKQKGEFKFTSQNPSIASVPAAHAYEADTPEVTIVVKGLSPGETKVLVSDSNMGWRNLEVEVIVLSPVPPPPPPVCPDSVVTDMTFQVQQDPGGHRNYIMLDKARVNFTRTGNNFTLTSNQGQVPRITGTVNLATCTFSGSGTATDEIANTPGVLAEVIDGKFLGGSPPGSQPWGSGPTNSIQFTYRLGGNGVFYGGHPTTYQASGPVMNQLCVVTPSPTQVTLPALGGDFKISIDAPDGCSWQATPVVDWLQPLSPTIGTGKGEVTYRTAPLTTPGTPRTTTITIGFGASARDVTVTQTPPAPTQPAIAGVVNGATFGGGITGSTWVTIMGSNLSTTTRLWHEGDFNGPALPTAIDGVSVLFGGTPGYPSYISPSQINVLLPDTIPPGPVNVTVQTPQGMSLPFSTVVNDAAPALFAFDPAGRRYPAAVHPDGTYLGPPGLFPGVTTRPATPNDVIMFFGTGCRDTDPPSPAGQLHAPAPLATPAVATIGVQYAPVEFAGKVGPGLCQFNIRIPEVGEGEHPLEIRVDGLPTQGGILLPVIQR